MRIPAKCRTTRLLAGICIPALAGIASPAFAANECGIAVTGQVVCTSAGNPYPAGISYTIVPDLSIITNADVVAQGTINGASTTGAVTITSNGQVVTTTATTSGIIATGVNTVTVTATAIKTSAADSAGIIATSTAGGVTVNAPSVTVGANGGAGILILAQNAVVVTSGNVSALNNSAVFARSQAGSVTANLNGANTSTTADTALSLVSGSTITVNVAAGASATGQNGLTLAPQTTSTVTNAGTITGTAGYAILANRGTTTVVNSGTLNSGVQFAGAGNSLTNSGTFNVTRFSQFGTAGTLTNTGLVQVTAAAPAGGVTLFGLGSFANAGTLSLANGRVGDILTLPGTFTGSGASALLLDTNGIGGADRLVVGGAVTGSTMVTLVPAVGGVGLLNTGTIIVQAGIGSSATAFTLASASAMAGFAQSAITYNAATGAFSLVSTPDAAAYRVLKYIEAARGIWYKSSDIWSAHMRALRDGTAHGSGLWAAMYGSDDIRHTSIATSVFGQTAVQPLSYQQTYFGGQLGYDLANSGPGGFALGITGGYTNSVLDFESSTSSVRYNAVNGGAYMGFNAGPVFFTALGKYDYYWLHAVDPTISLSQSLHGHSYGVTGEAGIHTLSSDGFSLEPLVTVSYVRTRLNNFTSLASTFYFNEAQGLRGKAGMRAVKSMPMGTATLTFYGGGNAVKEFDGTDGYTFTNNGSSLGFGNQRIGLYGEGYAGFNIRSAHGVTGFIEGTADIGGAGTQRGAGGRAGIQVPL